MARAAEVKLASRLLRPLIAVVGPLVAFALQQGERTWLRPMLNQLAAGLSKVWFVGHTLADGVLSIESAVRHYLGAQVLAAEAPLVGWLHGVRTFVIDLIYATSNQAVATAHAIEALADDVIRHLEVPVKVTLRETRTRVRVLDKKSVAAIAAAVASIIALKHTATVTVPGEIAGDIGDLRDYVNRKTNQLGKLIKRLEKPALGALTIGALWALLRKSGLGWLRCSRLPRTTKRLCGMDFDLFESLLADALLVVGAVSIVEFAKELQTIEGVTVDAMRGFVREL